ncbi:hypothetical protein K2173_005718 [Erythroxylum novogranatense]|uniref:TPX2 C-terminal domain-containing protein n=1 Tax=Erythroxylum novogranatense TaxID=1862640 RepID=A0AAV8SQK3_9ROSI|nr:hypothetical protein K2173_005718 [Erythroxylum novogranatense]
MESEKVELKDETVSTEIHVERSSVTPIKEEKGATNGDGPVNESETSEQEAKSVSESKLSNPSKTSATSKGSPFKSSKLTKEKSLLKGADPNSRNHKAMLSQSLSLSTNRGRPDNMQKSADGHQMKSITKNNPDDSINNKATRNGSAKSISSLSQQTKNLIYSRGDKSFSRQTSSSMLSAKSNSSNAAAVKHPSSEIATPADQSSKDTATLPNKEEEDTHSTTSSVATYGRRSSGSGFSFRLEERAEKRKEFFSKLEEKIQAKEKEKCNLQAKSKENQEAEIKQLRKSLTFKATPMPSFYKEPPPKVELKKVPTTRAISPKLGRHKSFNTARNNSSEGDSCQSPRSCHSPLVSQDSTNSTKGIHRYGNVASKAPMKKSQTKLLPQTTALNGKMSKSKSKPAAEDSKVSKDSNTTTEATLIDSANLRTYETKVESEIDDELKLAKNNPDFIPPLVAVGV